MKVKFTTNIDEKLLQRIKIKAIEENKNVNEIIEEQIQKYLGEELEMLKLTVTDHGEEEILKEGTLIEIIKYLQENEEIINWVQDEDPEIELPNLNEVKNIGDLEYELNKIDLDWWRLEVR